MPRRVLRAVSALALLAASATATTSCVTFGACPAIGWTNAVSIDVSAFPEVTDVQFCVDAECSPAPGAEPTSSTNLFAAIPQEDGSWSLAVDMAAPERIDIRLFDAQATLIHESRHAIAWTPSDAPCGGPSTADPLVLEP